MPASLFGRRRSVMFITCVVSDPSPASHASPTYVIVEIVAAHGPRSISLLHFSPGAMPTVDKTAMQAVELLDRYAMRLTATRELRHG